MLVLSFLLPSVSLFGGEVSPSVLDLDRCVRAALSQNPALVAAQEELDIAGARRRAATASLLAAVTFKADETRGRADQVSRQPSFVQRSHGVQVTQPLFAGGRLWAGRRQAALGVEAARLQLEKHRLDVRHAAVESFWRVVALERARELWSQACREVQEDLEKAVRHELSDSRGARIELLSARSQSRDCEAALSETEEELLEARTALLDVMGERRERAFRVPGEIPAERVEILEEEVLRLARAHRPEIKIAEKVMESARMARRVSGAVLFPRVDVNGFYGRSGAAFAETDPFEYKKDWNAGVSASWPLAGSTVKYTGFRERTSPRLGESSRTETESQSLSLSLADALSQGVEAREGRKAFSEEQWRYEKAVRDAESEALLAARRAGTAWARLSGANAKVEESLQQMKETRSLLQEDRGHLGDLAAARNRVAQAKAAQVQAQARYRAALSALNRAVGVADYFGAVK